MTHQETSDSILLRDPLSGVTRKERRYLLLFSTLGAFISFADIVPTEVSLLGISLLAADQVRFLALMAAITFYFIAAFCLYAWSDHTAWKHAYLNALINEKREEFIFDMHGGNDPQPGLEGEADEHVAPLARTRRKLSRQTHRISKCRAVVEFFLPPCFGTVVFVALVYRAFDL